MLRALLASSGCFGTVAYDVNYVWRLGNAHYPHDGLPTARATRRVQQQIRAALLRIAHRDRPGAPLLEKTVGNILRVPFVHRVFPEARYVFLIRDGWDVTESAARCWREPPRLGYLCDKLRTFPWQAWATYGFSFARRVSARMLGWAPHLSTWGPHHAQLEADRAECDLVELCARQWVACIRAYEHDRDVLKPTQRMEVRYEDLVRDPGLVIGELAQFLRLPDAEPLRRHAFNEISADHIGKHGCLDRGTIGRLAPLLEPVRRRWGYPDVTQRAA